MIETLKRTPYIYGEKSRDFQLISKLFDTSFNTSKIAIDTMLHNNGSENIDYRFVDLACKTIGFDYHGQYNTRELVAVIKSFKELVKNKGTKYAIEKAIELLLNSQSIKSGYYLEWHNKDKYIVILLPEGTTHTHLLDELFEYILPAGWLYSIVLQSVIQVDAGLTSDRIITNDTIRSIELKDAETDVSDYLDSNAQVVDMKYIGQVPKDSEGNFISPVVNFDTVISTPDKAKGE